MNSIDRRTFKRYKKETTFKLQLKTGMCDCRTIDYSAEGICLHMFDKKLSLLPGDTVEFTLQDPELEFLGEVVWIKEADNGHVAGFKRIGNFKGTCVDFQLADIMIGLQRTMKTGILEIIQGIRLIRVYIKDGDFIFANSNQEDDRLGEFLIKAGAITLRQFFDVSEQLKKTGKRLGEILVDRGHIKPAEIFKAIRQQVEHIILSVVTSECGTFEFKEGPLPSEETVTLNLSAAQLIYQGMKRMHNFQYILEDLPSLDSVLSLSQNPADLFQELSLDNNDKEILTLINGISTLEEILAGSSVKDFEAIKTIYALLCARIIGIKREDTPQEILPEEIIREPHVDVDADFLKEVNELYDTYKTLGLYDILGIQIKATDKEIKQAYWQQARAFHPDRHFACQSEDLKGKLNAIFTHINLAYSTLSNPEKRKQYDKSLSKQPEKPPSNTKIASDLFSEGKSKIMAGFTAEAEKLFREAIYFDNSNPDYHYYLGMALSRLEKFRESFQVFNTAIEMNPHNARYVAELGHVFISLGFNLRAKSSFHKALNISPTDERALEGIKIIEAS